MADEITPESSEPSPDMPPATVEPEPAAAADKPATPEADLGDAGKKALSAERTARKAAEKLANDLAAKVKAFEDEKLTELERAQREAADLRAATAKAEADAMRLRLATRYGISEEDAEMFLTGSTEEALTAQAERVAALRGESKRFKGSADGGARRESQPSIDDQIAEASKAGNHALAISLKRQKAYASNT